MTMDMYSTFYKTPKIQPHYQMQLRIIPMTRFVNGFCHLVKVQSAYFFSSTGWQFIRRILVKSNILEMYMSSNHVFRCLFLVWSRGICYIIPKWVSDRFSLLFSLRVKFRYFTPGTFKVYSKQWKMRVKNIFYFKLESSSKEKIAILFQYLDIMFHWIIEESSVI